METLLKKSTYALNKLNTLTLTHQEFKGKCARGKQVESLVSLMKISIFKS